MIKYFSLICLLWLVTLVSAQDYTPVFEASECPYFMLQLADEQNTDINCGYLHVPENQTDVEDSRELSLFVVRIESIQATDNAPIVYLEGGPGGAASASFEDWLASGLLPRHDIFLLDQRGTGLSSPSLNCYEIDDGEYEAGLEACRERLIEDEGIDLNAYNSQNNAHDVHDLLVALEIEEATLYGLSYGARLALTVARDFPDRIDAMIIDAVYPPQIDSLVTEAYYGNQAFEQLFADCAADSSCNAEYPDLRQSFYTAIRNMNDQPARVLDYELGYVVEMTGDDFVNEVFTMLYETETIPYIPALIDAYAQGDYRYDPQVEAEQIAFEQAVISKTIEPDEFDIAAMEYLDYTDVNALYAYYFSLDGQELDNLFNEIDEYAYYMLFREYLGYDTVAETAAYMNSLDNAEYAALVRDVTGDYDDDSEGMSISVECSEELHFYDDGDVLARIEGLPEVVARPLVESAIDSFVGCDIWDIAVSESIENEPVESDIPTLIFSGLYDPVTPHQWGESTGAYLSNSWHYVFPNTGHGALDVEPCATAIAVSFLDNPLQEPESACLEGLSAPVFFIGRQNED